MLAVEECCWLEVVMTVVQFPVEVPFVLRKDVRLLVIDDHPEYFERLTECSEMYNPEYKVECRLVTALQEALDVASEWEPSVVLVDLHVGEEALDYVKRIADVGAPVVATTETRMPDCQAAAQHRGAVGYVVKSEDQEDIEELLEYVASVARATITAQ
jgi:DNA-binding NarL/FixJ family response regulator